MTVTSLKIFITKNENTEKIILLDKPILLNSCSEIFVKSVSIFLNYDNLNKNIHHYTYDRKGANTKINFKDGYYTFNILKIELEQVDSTGKCTIKSDKELNLQTCLHIPRCY